MVAGIALLVISLGAIVAGRGYTRLARRMRSFAVTPGTVLEKRPTTVPSGDTTTGRWGKGGGYVPYVKYAYTVGGVGFTNDKVTYAFQGLKREIVEADLAAMPDTVDVHYNPADPQEAYLKTHTPTIGRWLIGGGAFGALFALVIILGSI